MDDATWARLEELHQHGHMWASQRQALAHLLVAYDRQAPIVQAAEAFIVDSEAAGGPPSESCQSCYWTLRAAVAAARAAGGGADDARSV